MRKSRCTWAFAFLILANLSLSHFPGLCEEISQPTSATSGKAAPTQPAPSPEDTLIVQVSDDADRAEFDDLLHGVHGTVIKTLEVGSQLKLLVIQTQPGKADEVKMRFAKEKDIVRVQRNQTYHIDEDPIAAPSDKSSTLRYQRR